jgi:hypothetical protein
MIEHGQNTDNLRMVPLSYSPKMLKRLVEPMGVEPTAHKSSDPALTDGSHTIILEALTEL